MLTTNKHTRSLYFLKFLTRTLMLISVDVEQIKARFTQTPENSLGDLHADLYSYYFPL